MCVGCRERAAKNELLRIVVGSETGGRLVVVPDPNSTAAGRGAYLHPTTDCYELAVRRRAIPRALKAEVGVASTAVGNHVADLGRVLNSTTT